MGNFRIWRDMSQEQKFHGDEKLLGKSEQRSVVGGCTKQCGEKMTRRLGEDTWSRQVLVEITVLVR